MLSFDNIEVAFHDRSNAELKKAQRMFQLVGKPWLVKLGSIFAVPSLYLGFRGLIKKTIFAHFCGGESIDQCDQAISRLAKSGIGTILDYSVEGETDEENLDATSREIIATAEKAAGNDHIPFCVFKVTGVARFDLLEKISAGKTLSAQEEADWIRVKQRVHAICKAADGGKTPVFIDAEESWIQPAIDDLARDMMREFNQKAPIVFNTYQLYRHDRLAYLKNDHALAEKEGYFIGAKLVRGAYMEKERDRAKEKGYPSPIQPDKEASDRDYDLALEFCLQHIDRFAICAGTHNEHSSYHLTELMRTRAIRPDDKRVWFAQLLGMSDHISFNLANEGYNVAKYVPYGPVREVLPYLIRRAQENTSVKGQTGRELSLISREIKRRKAEGKAR